MTYFSSPRFLSAKVCVAFLASSLMVANALNASDVPTNANQGAIGIEEVTDGTVVTVTGDVFDIADDEFTLTYGKAKSVVIELDRFNWSGNETQYLRKGESVTVSGLVDDDFMEGKEIKAYNVKLNDRFAYYYTTKEHAIHNHTEKATLPEDGTYLSVTGKIVDITAPEMTIQSKNGLTIIDTADLNYNPFDEKGVQKLKKGDQVFVHGDVDVEAWDETEIVADVVIQMNPAHK